MGTKAKSQGTEGMTFVASVIPGSVNCSQVEQVGNLAKRHVGPGSEAGAFFRRAVIHTGRWDEIMLSVIILCRVLYKL